MSLGLESTSIVFDKDWLGFKKDQRTNMPKNNAEVLARRGIVHMDRQEKSKEVRSLNKIVEESIFEPDHKVRDLKRPEKDKMVKKAVVSK